MNLLGFFDVLSTSFAYSLQVVNVAAIVNWFNTAFFAGKALETLGSSFAWSV